MTVYTFEDTDGGRSFTFETFDAKEAKEFGEKNDLLVIANEYEWVDSEIAFDFRGENPNDKD